MREIRFRGIKKGKNHFVYGNLSIKFDMAFIQIYLEDTRSYEDIEVKPETIGQFTGLKDCNDKMIFEGDIVAFTAEDELWEPHYYQGSVYFCDGTFWVDCGKDNDDNDVLFSIGHALLADKNIQVIGNIHDNPELLK